MLHAIRWKQEIRTQGNASQKMVGKPSRCKSRWEEIIPRETCITAQMTCGEGNDLTPCLMHPRRISQQSKGGKYRVPPTWAKSMRAHSYLEMLKAFDKAVADL